MSLTTRDERAAFEAWVSASPYEHDTQRFNDSACWPNQYRSLTVQLAWEAWCESSRQDDAELVQLRVAFATYADHTADCASSWYAGRKCDCGLGKIKKGRA